MSDILHFEFALHDPAMAIAPVFLVLKKGERGKLDVSFTFKNSELHWRGPDALGIVEQSVLLGLLCIAAQQQSMLQLHPQTELSKKLLDRLTPLFDFNESEFAVLKASWKKIALASGHRSKGGKNVDIVKDAIKRLAETTIWEKRDGKVYQSRLLSWLVGDAGGVCIALNTRITEALYGGQYVWISLSERHSLTTESSKALHAWLSANLHQGRTRVYTLEKLQSHVWPGIATGSALSSRKKKLRHALSEISQFPTWSIRKINDEAFEVQRAKEGTISKKVGDYLYDKGTISKAKKMIQIQEKI